MEVRLTQREMITIAFGKPILVALYGGWMEDYGLKSRQLLMGKAADSGLHSQVDC